MNIKQNNSTQRGQFNNIQNLKVKTQLLKKQINTPQNLTITNVSQNYQELVKMMADSLGKNNQKLVSLYKQLQDIELKDNKNLQQNIQRQQEYSNQIKQLQDNIQKIEQEKNTLQQQYLQKIEEQNNELVMLKEYKQQMNNVKKANNSLKQEQLQQFKSLEQQLKDSQQKSQLDKQQLQSLYKNSIIELNKNIDQLTKQKYNAETKLLQEQKLEKGISLQTIDGMMAQFIQNIMTSDNDREYFQTRIVEQDGNITKQISESIKTFVSYYNGQTVNNSQKSKQQQLLQKITDIVNNESGDKKMLMYSALIYLSQFAEGKKQGVVSINVQQIRYIYSNLQILTKIKNDITNSQKSINKVKDYYKKIKSLDLSSQDDKDAIDEQYSQIINVFQYQTSQEYDAFRGLVSKYQNIEQTNYNEKQQILLNILKTILQKHKDMFNMAKQLMNFNMIQFDNFEQLNNILIEQYQYFELSNTNISPLNNLSGPNAQRKLKEFISDNSQIRIAGIQQIAEDKSYNQNAKIQVTSINKTDMTQFLDVINKNLQKIKLSFFNFNFIVKEIDQKIKRIPTVLVNINYKQYSQNPQLMKMMLRNDLASNTNNSAMIFKKFRDQSGRVVLKLKDGQSKKIDATVLLNNIVDNLNYEEHIGKSKDFQVQKIVEGGSEGIRCHPTPLEIQKDAEVKNKTYDFTNALNILENKTNKQLYTDVTKLGDDDDTFSLKLKLDQTRLNGDNIILFGYGQSGSGKTFSLINDTADKINPQMCISDKTCQTIMYQYVADMLKEGASVSIFSIFEIYGRVQPLMKGKKSQLKINTSDVDDTTCVDGKFNIYKKIYTHEDILTEDKKVLKSVDQLRSIYLSIDKKRKEQTFTVQATNNNAESSRSQLFIIIRVENNQQSKPGHAIFVDMAGIENSYDIFIENQHGKDIIEFLGLQTKSQTQTQITQSIPSQQSVSGITYTPSYIEYKYNKNDQSQSDIQFNNILNEVNKENQYISQIIKNNIQNVLLKNSFGASSKNTTSSKRLNLSNPFGIFLESYYEKILKTYENVADENYTKTDITEEDVYILILYMISDLWNSLIMTQYMTMTGNNKSSIQQVELKDVYAKYQQQIIIKQRAIQEIILKAQQKIIGDKNIHNDILSLSKLFSHVMKSIKLLRLLNGQTKNDFIRIIDVNRAPIVFMEGFFINESINQLKQLLKFKNREPQTCDILFNYSPSKYLDMGQSTIDRKDAFGVLNCIEYLSSQCFNDTSEQGLIVKMRELLKPSSNDTSRIKTRQNIKQKQPEIFLLTLLDPQPETFDQNLGAFETLEFIQSIVSDKTIEEQQQDIITRKTLNKFPLYSEIFFNMISLLLSFNLYQSLGKELTNTNLYVEIPHKVKYSFKDGYINKISEHSEYLIQQQVFIKSIQNNYQKFINVISFQFICFGIIMYLYLSTIKNGDQMRSLKQDKVPIETEYTTYLYKLAQEIQFSDDQKLSSIVKKGYNSFDKKKFMNNFNKDGEKQIGNLYSYMNSIMSNFFYAQNDIDFGRQLPYFYNFMLSMFQNLYGQQPSTLQLLNKNIYYVLYDIYSNPKTLGLTSKFNYYLSHNYIDNKTSAQDKQYVHLTHILKNKLQIQIDSANTCTQQKYKDIISQYPIIYQQDKSMFDQASTSGKSPDKNIIENIYINHTTLLGYYFQEIFNIYDQSQKNKKVK